MIKITAGIPAALATATFAIATFAIATPAVALAGTDTGPQTRVSAAAAEKAPSRTGTGPSATGPKPAAANS